MLIEFIKRKLILVIKIIEKMAFSKRKMSRFVIEHYQQDLYFIINGFAFETHGCWIWL